ncbi:MAG: radical SAM protein, partial [Ruminococcus sp.]
FEVLKTLHDEGIPTVVWLCPILPYLNDTEDNIKRLLEMCVEAKVRGILCFGMGLTLREGNREYFYEQLDRHFPMLKQRYIRNFGNQYVINSPHDAELMRLFHRTCEANGILHNNDEIFDYLHRFEEKNAPQQLTLWDMN